MHKDYFKMLARQNNFGTQEGLLLYVLESLDSAWALLRLTQDWVACGMLGEPTSDQEIQQDQQDTSNKTMQSSW